MERVITYDYKWPKKKRKEKKSQLYDGIGKVIETRRTHNEQCQKRQAF